jgi:hypothetical protein
MKWCALSPRILKDEETVSARIRKYDSEPKGPDYNRAYCKVLEARGGKGCLVDDDGSISESSLSVVAKSLRVFLPETNFVERPDTKLQEKLSSNEIMVALRNLRLLKISSLPQIESVQELRTYTNKLYEVLSAGGEESLDKIGQRFDVGASKTMNFIFPDLFVIADDNVMYCCFKGHWALDFERYWQVMLICQGELQDWQQQHGDMDRLLKLDMKPTTATRIFDKCAFIMGKYRETREDS